MLLTMALTPAAAARVVAPPGLPEAEQYYQTVPTSTGPRAPDTTKKARDAVRDGALGQATEEALRRRGPTGLAVATVVAQTAPEGGAAADKGQPPALGSLGDRGLGAAFPLLLLLMAAAAIAFGVSRRRYPAR